MFSLLVRLTWDVALWGRQTRLKVSRWGGFFFWHSDHLWVRGLDSLLHRCFTIGRYAESKERLTSPSHLDFPLTEMNTSYLWCVPFNWRAHLLLRTTLQLALFLHFVSQTLHLQVKVGKRSLISVLLSPNRGHHSRFEITTPMSHMPADAGYLKLSLKNYCPSSNTSPRASAKLRHSFSWLEE